MTDSKTMLNQLREQVSESKKKLEKQENALRIVENMIKESSKKGTVITEDKTPKNSTQETLQPRTIVDNVASVLPDLSTQQYTVSDVYNLMDKAGVAPEHKSRISTVLRKMVKREKVEIISKGTGKTPSVYKSIT
jgi:hypothetical protein